MHPAFLVPAPCPANLTLPEVQHSRMAEGAVADYLAGLGVAYALKTRQSLGSDWLCFARWCAEERSEEHTSELQSLMRISYAVFCLKKDREDSYTVTLS